MGCGPLCLDPAQPHAFGCPVALRVITATPGGGRRTSGSSLRPRQCARCSTAEPGSLSSPVFMTVLWGQPHAPCYRGANRGSRSAGHLLKVEQPVSGRAEPTAGFLWPDPASWTRLVTGWEKADWKGLGVQCLGWGPTKSPERALPPFWEWQSPKVWGGEHICFLGAS